MVTALREMGGNSKSEDLNSNKKYDFDAYGKIARRTDGLYRADKDLPRRKSQDNPAIIETYKKVIPEGPCSHKSHHLLHTKYAKRGNFR